MTNHLFNSKRAWIASALALAFIATCAPAIAQQFNPDLFKSLHWRSIGPFRGGRTRAVAGVPSQPNVFYIAQVNGGVWKTTDYGRTWTPIFDDQPTGSVGCIAVAPSNPNIIYVGSGEGLQRPDLSVGDGIYKSTDAGKTWTHLGLRDGQQIPQIAVDPRDPNRILVAVAGHPYGPNEERGIFRSVDGGQTFEKVLYKDENIGGADVLIDPTNPDTAYAALWEARQGPWENAAWNGTGGGIFKSTDGGKTWRQLSGGLPDGIIQANLAIAPSSPNRLFASVAVPNAVNFYRSDDGGNTWAIATKDARPAGRIGGGDLAVPRFDPKNPDVVYSASTVSWKSIDGGKTWTGFSRRARRRRLSKRLDQSEQSGRDFAGQRSRRDHYRQRRQVVEQLVQPTDGPALSRQRRQRFSVSIVQRPAGERLGLCCQSRQRWRDHFP